MSRLPFLRKRAPQSLFVKAPAGPAGCTMPDMFTDCFTGLSGTLTSPLSPPIGGWDYDTGFIPGGGTVTFDGDLMILAVGGGPTSVGATKSHGVGTFPADNYTVQFAFTEFSLLDPLNFYFVPITNEVGTMFYSLFLDGSGGVTFQVTDPSLLGSNTFTGVWTQTGGSHVVHTSVLPGGTAVMFIDQVPIPLVGAPSGTPIGLTVGVIGLDAFRFSGIPDTMSYDYAIINSGVQPPTTVYCCPDGNPAT